MNLKSIVYFSMFGIMSPFANAQQASDQLLKINDTPFTVGEFERIYTKNFDLIKDEQQKDIDNYLDLFILYKLKVAKAYELGLEKSNSFISEFNSHRSQLSEQYLTNQETLDRLAKEAFERSREEIRASHIIFLADEFSTPEDTLKAYNKAIEVRNLISQGLDFNEAALTYSDDVSAKVNKGDLGYFSALRMVYPFETGAYQTNIGEVSMPIRSQFGYHLIKVHDRRPRHGKREVAHIVIENKDTDFADSGKIIIDQVYDQLQSGTPFEDLVVEYSDDTSSKSNKGILPYYEPGVINTDNFDEAVYNLSQIGTYSKPFKSQFGWHIVKLVSEEDQPTFQDRKQWFLRKVQSDNRSRIINEQLVKDLKPKYNYKEHTKNYNDFVKFVKANVNKTEWLTTIKENKTLAQFGSHQITNTNFADYIQENNINFEAIDPIENGIRYCFDQMVSNEILKYYNENLENEFPEFKNTVQEFKEGLLLFDLMEEEIWKKVKNDTIGYTNFYKTHINNYVEKEAIVGKIYESASKSNIQNALKQVKKLNPKKADLEVSTKTYLITKGKFEKGNKNLPSNYVLKEGISEIFEQNGRYYFVVADQYLPERILDLDEAKQNVIYEYQQVYEDEWIENLRKNAKVQINEPVLIQLKTKYRQK